MDENTKEFFQNSMNSIIEQMNKGFAEVNQKFTEMNQKFETRFAEMDQKFEARFAEMDQKFEARFAEHDKKFEEIQRTLVIIEDKISNEIPALFDGYNANNEHYEMLEKRVSELEEKENLNSLKISILEDKVG